MNRDSDRDDRHENGDGSGYCHEHWRDTPTREQEQREAARAFAIRIELGAESVESDLESAPHCTFGHSETSRDLCRREIFDIAEHDRRAIWLCEREHGARHRALRLGPREQLFGRRHCAHLDGRFVARPPARAAEPHPQQVPQDPTEPSCPMVGGGAVCHRDCVVRQLVCERYIASDRTRKPAYPRQLGYEIGLELGLGHVGLMPVTAEVFAKIA
jgi:hypothetical protein